MATLPQRHTQIAGSLHDFDFRKLFIEELGWDRYSGSVHVTIKGGVTFSLAGTAVKRGVVALVCDPDARGGIPDYATRKLIEDQVVKQVREHLIIFTDAARTRQFWLWTKRAPGQRAQYRGESFNTGQTGERLVRKLQEIVIPLASEDNLTLLDVTTRLEKGFDIERVTKKFYDRFQVEHPIFMRAITGIADDELRRWYASLMLNRLMFTYFIQKKRFLDGDTDYLRQRLERVRALGADKFHSFYRGFLLRLFHDGLGKPAAARRFDPELAQLIGNVPYLNGGLFDVHHIESGNREIAIPDEAFTRIFSFFDDFDWCLDDRPLRNDKEINPDVLGYIFEKYINQKQMGAYYTKEDITGYIGRNTILPFLFEQAREQCRVAFAPGGEVWRLPQDDPDRYLYAAVRQGVDEPLPPEIAAGITAVAARSGWNRPAPQPYALPTETWREHIARRQRCLDLRERLAQGEVTEVNDLVTYNLDIERLARDVIERCEGPEVLRAFWQALTSVTILDPTCGSGAFLFAALSILKPLYEACLDRMQAFVTDFDRLGERQKGADFRAVLARVAQHPKRDYFILKSIIINNLYGVDIMAEACEIAKLRLFLSLVAQVEDVAKLEPLPDIDFNIRAGNTLVGFTTLDAVRQAMTYDTAGRTRKLLLDPRDEAALASINERAEIVGRAYQQFQRMQSEHGMDAAAFHSAKEELRQRLDALRHDLDRHLARDYGVDPDSLFAFEPWRASHQPLHWFVEFYGIVQGRGGFDVIIGNPPFVEYSSVRDTYAIHGYKTLDCGNLYVFVVERSHQIVQNSGRCGMILPLSSLATANMHPFKKYLFAAFPLSHVSFYHRRPGQLFEGALISVAIVLLSSDPHRQGRFSTVTNRWTRETRIGLFDRILYSNVTTALDSFYYPKFSIIDENRLWNKLHRDPETASVLAASRDSNSAMHYRTAGGGYWLSFLDFVYPVKTVSNKFASFRSGVSPHIMTAVYNSTLFYWYYSVTFDAFNMKEYLVWSFRFDPTHMSASAICQLEQCCHELMDNYRANAEYIQRGKSMSYTVYPKLAKPIIDEIDRVLAQHYGFTDEELDFIINYDIKYRMGQESGESDEA